jgi:hypothetical protein
MSSGRSRAGRIGQIEAHQLAGQRFELALAAGDGFEQAR